MDKIGARVEKVTKADRTRRRILETAEVEASRYGIETLSLGKLANLLGMSKSGIYAHFGSMESLQIDLIDTIAARFVREVATPALAAPQGRSRLITIMKHWVAWSQHVDRPGGCQLISATFDFDALEGPVRVHLANWIELWREAIFRTARAARMQDGSIRIDPDEAATLAFGIYMSQHLESYMLDDRSAAARAIDLWARSI